MNAHDKDTEKRRARLFRNGRSQAVRIPKEWEFEGDEIVIERAKGGVIKLKPSGKKTSLLDVLANLKPLPEGDRMPAITDDDLLPLDDVAL